jgi:hypothetical protein
MHFLDVKISKKVAQSAALSVINSHRCPATGETAPTSQPYDFTLSEEKKIEALQCLASHRGINIDRGRAFMVTVSLANT